MMRCRDIAQGLCQTSQAALLGPCSSVMPMSEVSGLSVALVKVFPGSPCEWEPRAPRLPPRAAPGERLHQSHSLSRGQPFGVSASLKGGVGKKNTPGQETLAQPVLSDHPKRTRKTGELRIAASGQFRLRLRVLSSELEGSVTVWEPDVLRGVTGAHSERAAMATESVGLGKGGGVGDRC